MARLTITLMIAVLLSATEASAAHNACSEAEAAAELHVSDSAARAGLQNVETRVVAADDTGLAPGEADLVFISKTWHACEWDLLFGITRE